jgi:hypothetical protein
VLCGVVETSPLWKCQLHVRVTNFSPFFLILIPSSSLIWLTNSFRSNESARELSSKVSFLIFFGFVHVKLISRLVDPTSPAAL